MNRKTILWIAAVAVLVVAIVVCLVLLLGTESTETTQDNRVTEFTELEKKVKELQKESEKYKQLIEAKEKQFNEETLVELEKLRNANEAHEAIWKNEHLPLSNISAITCGKINEELDNLKKANGRTSALFQMYITTYKELKDKEQYFTNIILGEQECLTKWRTILQAVIESTEDVLVSNELKKVHNHITTRLYRFDVFKNPTASIVSFTPPKEMLYEITPPSSQIRPGSA